MKKQTVLLAGLAVISFTLVSVLSGCAHKAAETSAPAASAAAAPAKAEPTPIEAAMLEHNAAFTACYQKHLHKTKSNNGKVVTAFHVSALGKVTHVSVQSTTLKNPKTEACILKAIKKVKFPKAQDAKGVDTSYPFEFASDKETRTDSAP